MRKAMRMRPVFIFKMYIMVFAFSLAFTSCFSNQAEKVAFEQAQAIDARPFLSENELLRSVSEDSWAALGLANYDDSENAENKAATSIKGIVVPHHAAAAALTAECISRLAHEPPPAVIILAPNHYNAGAAAIGTTCDFICHGQRVSTDSAAIKRLNEAGLISISDGPFEREHSVGMLLPVIAWYLPETKVIPIIFHGGYDEQKIIAIMEALEPEIDAGAVIIASIDFSHYLPMEEAKEKDREMREYLENGDARVISKLDSSYIDSPTIMAAMLLHFGTNEMKIIANTNSGILMRNPVSPCTSYFTIQWMM